MCAFFFCARCFRFSSRFFFSSSSPAFFFSTLPRFLASRSRARS
jgi:phosphatidate phosphatase APP1